MGESLGLVGPPGIPPREDGAIPLPRVFPLRADRIAPRIRLDRGRRVPGGSNVDLTFSAQITDEGLIAGAVTAVFLLPVAVLGGAVSYAEYETDAQNLIVAFWQVLSVPSGAATDRPTSAMPAKCKGCGAALLPDWKVCPYCGRARN